MKKVITLTVSIILSFILIRCNAEDALAFEWSNHDEISSYNTTTYELTEINWSDVEPILSFRSIEGAFATISDVGLKMFVPLVFHEDKLSGDALYNGYIFSLSTENNSAWVLVSSGYSDETLEDLAARINGDTQIILLNGIHVLIEKWMEGTEEAVGVTIQTEDGQLVMFEFPPSEDIGFQALESIMIASIQKE